MALDKTTYQGNRLLKKAGISASLTVEEMLEIELCIEDPLYFIEKYVKIVHPDRGVVPMKLYPYQEEIVKSMHENRNTIIATARQVGKTTSAVGYVLWYALFNRNKVVAILANKGDTSKKVLASIKAAFMRVPKFMQQGIVDGGWNKETVLLENETKIIAAATSSDAIRGETINLLIVDEAAHIEQWDEFWMSVSPTISASQTSKVVLISTPNGLNHFYTTWAKAEKGDNDYNPIKVMWYEAPNRDEAWKQKTLTTDLNGDIAAFEQEYCVEFLGSSGTLISGGKLRELNVSYMSPDTDHDHLRQWKRVEDKHNYVLVADVSRGKGLDYSAFHVIDVTTVPYEQVATYRNNMVISTDYAAIIFRIAKYYNNASVLVELNDLGAQVVDYLHEDPYEYENIMYTTTKGSRNGKQLSSGFGGGNRERGIRTTVATKALGCAMIKMLIEQNKLKIVDKQTVMEMNTFSKKGKSYEAEPGNHDDLMMGLVLFGWLADQKLFRELTDVNILQALREQDEDQMNAKVAPFGFIDNGRQELGEEPIDFSDDPLPFSWFVQESPHYW